jgi:hypothetical protein
MSVCKSHFHISPVFVGKAEAYQSQAGYKTQLSALPPPPNNTRVDVTDLDKDSIIL